ncbi:hypothetical protein MXB_4207, partial [Myxobolus squamalis]
SKSDTETSGNIILAEEDQNKSKNNWSQSPKILEDKFNVKNLHNNRLCSQSVQTKLTTTISSPREDEDWWIAINSNGIRGNIPGNYVEIIDQAQQNVSKPEFNDDRRVSSKSYTSNEKDDHISIIPNKNKDTCKTDSRWSNQTDSICKADNMALNRSTKVINNKSDESFNKNCTRFPKYIASFSCTKEADNELTFEENDILLIIDTNDSGWWVAKNMAGEEGLVPFNYLTKL